ncbi:hypothetical protein Tco_0916356, partial [Tanacetum coccineum]
MCRFCWLHFCRLGLSLVIQLSFDKPKRSYRHLFSGPELAEGFQDAFLGVDPRDVSVPMVGGQSVNGGGVTSADDIYIGETDSAKPRENLQHMEGSKVFVSAAAGSVGNFVG